MARQTNARKGIKKEIDNRFFKGLNGYLEAVKNLVKKGEPNREKELPKEKK